MVLHRPSDGKVRISPIKLELATEVSSSTNKNKYEKRAAVSIACLKLSCLSNNL